MQYYIYKITNMLNGKCYIGQHKVPKHPESLRRYLGGGIAIQDAIKKYGKDAFKKEIVEYIDDDEKHHMVSEREIYYIKFFNTLCPNGYNISPGGEGGATPESCRKSAITRKQRGYSHSVDTRRRISISNMGKPKSDEHRRHLSEHHRLKQMHQIVFEDGRESVFTDDAVRVIARKYGTSSRSLIRASMRNVFNHGIKLSEYRNEAWELHWNIARYGLFRDPITGELRDYHGMCAVIRFHTSYDHTYDGYKLWDLFETFTEDYLCKHNISNEQVKEIKQSELYRKVTELKIT